jgi:hypothetical protein
MHRLLSPLALIMLLTFACDAQPEAAPTNAPTPGKAIAPEPAKPEDDVKTHGAAPVKTESELAAEDSARDECVRTCVSSKAREARSAEDIERGCKETCATEIPIEQVEVAPDRPPGM